MRLLLLDADRFQHVENRLALYLKLSSQIVNSNLHPLRKCLQGFLLRDHNDLTIFN